MHDTHTFLLALTLVLCVAAVTTVLFQRLKQPVILGYILAGVLVGPYVAFPLFADQTVVSTLSELGVILLMFSLGLEFSLRKLLKVGPAALLTALIETSLMMSLGFGVGRLLGWTTSESLFAGGIVAISSTTIIARTFAEQNVSTKLRERVVGVLVVEDLIAVLLMATLTAISTGQGLSTRELALTSGRLVAFLVGLIAVGLFLIPRAVRAVAKLDRPETTLVASIGLAFAIALLAQWFGYSVALGAFLAGSLVAESGEEKKIEHLVQPVRDMFAAIFFVSVGMLIDPLIIKDHIGAVLVITVVVMAGKIIAVTLGSFLSGSSPRTSIQAGMSMAQIGEFSFIIAGLGLSLKTTGSFLYPIAVAVSAITTLTTPILVKASGSAANFVDRKLPHRLQTFVTLYGSWIERIKSAPRKDTLGAAVRRLIGWLILDTALVVGLVVAASLSMNSIAEWLTTRVGISQIFAQRAIIVAAIVLCGPFVVGVVSLSRRLGTRLSLVALPKRGDGKVDLANAPRRVLAVSIQLIIVFGLGIPVVAITQPFLGGVAGPVVLFALLMILGVAFWRSATNLQGHVQAGAQMIAEALAAQSQVSAPMPTVDELLPGLGAPTSFRLAPESAAVGKTLAQLNLRGTTGATVLAIHRRSGVVGVPTASEILREGDVLALAGTSEAVDSARALLG